MAGITLKEVGGDLVIDVLQESTVIGRGQFLQVTDKRVSRSHALLELKGGKLYITPTHTNPCFLRTQVENDQSVLTRDVKHLLNDGDEFGLLPDQLFYKVIYPQINGKESATKGELKKEDPPQEQENNKGDGMKPIVASNGDAGKVKSDEDKGVQKEADTNNSTALKEKADVKNEEKVTASEDSKIDKIDDDGNIDKDNDEKDDDMAMPVDKKRVLPSWMVKAANQDSPTKEKQSPKKPTSAAVNKRAAGEKLTKPVYKDDDEEEEEEVDEDEEEEYVPKKRGKGKRGKGSDDSEEGSDDDYAPEKPVSRNQKGRGKKKRKAGSDSEEDDISDDDDDYSPRKAKSKKKTPQSKGKKKTPVKQSRTGGRTATPRSRSRKKVSDDEDDEVLPRRRGGDDDDDEETTSSRRPQRAAKDKRGSYVDDAIEEALEDFASEEEVVEDKDSDFEVDGMEESGSDWEKSATGSQKQKASKVKGRAPPRTPSRRGSAVKGKKKARRPSRMDSDEDDDIMDDDEPYVPRPSKRRGGLLSQDTEDSDDGKKKRKREPCQYGKKCYRKNPVHFRTFCHPGDSSFDEEDKDESGAKDKKEKDTTKASPPKPSRPQRSTAGTKLVTTGADDDDQPDTYDYQDSFIDDKTQQSEEEGEGEADSDYDAEEDLKGLKKDAKAFVKGKKD